MYFYLLLIFIIFLFYFMIYKYEKFDNIIKHDKYDNYDKYIDVVYFINLDHRKDRHDLFLDEMKKYNIPLDKVIRISAIYDKDKPDLACTRSHIKTLETFINSPHKTCIIFEDDFVFDNNTNLYNINKVFDDNIDFDVIMLSSVTIEEQKSNYNYLNKVSNAQTASGYLVNRNFAEKLLENFKEGEKIFSEAYDLGDKKDYIYAVDQYWKKLQPNSKWYVFYPKLGLQRESYSDILKSIVNYKN